MPRAAFASGAWRRAIWSRSRASRPGCDCGSATYPRSCTWPAPWRPRSSPATRAARPGAIAWTTSTRPSASPSRGSSRTVGSRPAGPSTPRPTGATRAGTSRRGSTSSPIAAGRRATTSSARSPRLWRRSSPRRGTNDDRAEGHTPVGAVPSLTRMSPGPRPDRLPAETGSGPPREQWQSLRAFVAGGDGGRVRPRSRSAHGHVQQGTRPARNLPPTRGRKAFRPAVEAPAEGLRPGRRLRSAPFRLAPSSSTGGRVAEVEAHITGTVWKIECEVGDEIDEGDTVVILESMKMEMPVEAEDAGTVKEILCEEGQAVNEGDTLVILE